MKLIKILLTTLCLFIFTSSVFAHNWQEITKKSKGQTVFWNAWGGSVTINSYISWVAKQVKQKYGITLKHVKLKDTADAVSRVLAEKTAGKNKAGSVDLIWINGENFATMKRNGLLYGPFVTDLPNYFNVDYENKSSITNDFGLAVDGYESPWGFSQFVFSYDTAITKNPPKTMEALLNYAKKNKGKITYPAPPDFTGTSFLKQLLYETVPDSSLLQKKVSRAEFNKNTKRFWKWLEEIKPYLWRQGKAYPKNDPEMVKLLNDGEIDLAFSFGIGLASSHILKGDLPKTIRTFVLKNGTISNTHFVAIPYNSSSKEAAQVVANFLLSAEAQAKKLAPANWGDYTVLNIKKLSKKEQALFDIDLGIATLKPDQLGKALPEPHVSWVEPIESEWKKRFLK